MLLWQQSFPFRGLRAVIVEYPRALDVVCIKKELAAGQSRTVWIKNMAPLLNSSESDPEMKSVCSLKQNSGPADWLFAEKLLFESEFPQCGVLFFFSLFYVDIFSSEQIIKTCCSTLSLLEWWSNNALCLFQPQMPLETQFHITISVEINWIFTSNASRYLKYFLPNRPFPKCIYADTCLRDHPPLIDSHSPEVINFLGASIL